jgi:uncharacterized protein YdhG (YjbR/CyaY superfamily)
MQPSPSYKTVDEYIALQPEDRQFKLEIIRKTIKATVPEAVEGISYQMPYYKYHGMLSYFAVFKDHYSLFVSPAVHEAFSDVLKPYKTTKSAIHFPLDSEIPVKLIESILRFAAISNLRKAEAKKSERRK